MISPLSSVPLYPTANILTRGLPSVASFRSCRMNTVGSLIVYCIFSPSSSDIFRFSIFSIGVSNSSFLILPPGKSQSPKLSFRIKSFPSFSRKIFTATK